MIRKSLQQMSISELVDLFTEIALAQDAASLRDEIAKYNRLFKEMSAVSAELKSRPGDQRRALVALYRSDNMQVRLKAAIHTLAVAPTEARSALRVIADTKWSPQCLDAGMSLRLESGVFKPT